MEECKECKYFDQDEGYCTAMICTPLSCDELLPCEETDGVTLMVMKGVSNEEDFDFDGLDDLYDDGFG